MGYCYLHEIGLEKSEKNKTMAKEWYEKAERRGSAPAMCNLGDIYYNEKKYDLAKEWYEKAVEKGN